jgi:hypothetical protein
MGVTMKRAILAFLAVLSLAFLTVWPSLGFGQETEIRPSLQAGVRQTLGTDTVVMIEYSRPGVKGRKIWGSLVPYGLAPGNADSGNKPFPWRAGANENTTIEFNRDLLIEGKPLPAGKYGIHMIPSEKEWIVIFSTDNSAWGSFTYDPAKDALRVTVTPVKAPFQEWLAYGFDDLVGTSATAFLHWEQLKVPFKIALAR